jgi:RND family efflux transporter MFP subunit
MLLTAIIFLPASASAQGRAAAVGVQTVEERVLSETVPVFAEVITARDGAVAGRVAGTVQQVHVLVGDVVEADDLLVELNRDLLTIRVDQSQAQIAETQAGTATAQARLNRADLVFGRVQALRDTSAFSQGRFDDAEANVLEARSQLAEAQSREKSAEARLAETQYQLQRSEIRAPFSGVVLEVTTIPGAFIQAGTSVVRIIDTGAFEVRANVPSRYASFLREGTEMTGQTDAGLDVMLVVRAVLPVEDPSTRTRSVLLTPLDGTADKLVAVGQSLSVSFPVEEPRSVLSVPKDALVQARDGWTVFVAADDAAQIRNISLGVPLGDRYEVLDGLQAGDLVVVRGNERLRPGQAISASVVEAN